MHQNTLRMKKAFISLSFLIFSACLYAQSLFVGTYNIRNHNSGDDANGDVWAKRCQVICDQLNFEHPDIFGTQEVLVAQLHDLLHGLDGYGSIGVGRDDGKEAGEYSAIFYNKKRIRMLSHGDFWLSPTPAKPGLGWDAACIRICTYGKFRDVDAKRTFFYFNLHMDHVGVVARRESAKLVVKRIRAIAGRLPVILTGDFNVDQTDEIYQIFAKSGILKDSYTAARLRFAENGTFNSFDPNMKTDSRIDHVFVSPSFHVDRYGILTNSYWTENADSGKQLKGKDAPQQINFSKFTHRLPSDHYPVLVKLIY
jgi:endonuclease/exonuclease/phosphatase family metal-dependent hydrolase